MDIKTPEERSKNMAKIKSTKTKPELYIRALFFHNGLRFRVNYPKIEGKPDLYFPKNNVAVFVHGCFWHRHKNCPYAYTPKTNTEFWIHKLNGNCIHDEKILSKLKTKNIRVLLIWECSIKHMQKNPTLKNQILLTAKTFIQNDTSPFLEL